VAWHAMIAIVAAIVIFKTRAAGLDEEALIRR
jgi:hypothetical protein